MLTTLLLCNVMPQLTIIRYRICTKTDSISVVLYQGPQYWLLGENTLYRKWHHSTCHCLTQTQPNTAGNPMWTSSSNKAKYPLGQLLPFFEYSILHTVRNSISIVKSANLALPELIYLSNPCLMKGWPLK